MKSEGCVKLQDGSIYLRLLASAPALAAKTFLGLTCCHVRVGMALCFACFLVMVLRGCVCVRLMHACMCVSFGLRSR